QRAERQVDRLLVVERLLELLHADQALAQQVLPEELDAARGLLGPRVGGHLALEAAVPGGVLVVGAQRGLPQSVSTARRACSRSSCENGFWMNRSAPTCRHSVTASSVPSELTMITRAPGSTSRISLSASLPLMRGMTMSMSTRSGLSSLNLA